MWRARYHEILSWDRLGDRIKVRELAGEFADRKNGDLPEIPRDILDLVTEVKQRGDEADATETHER